MVGIGLVESGAELMALLKLRERDALLWQGRKVVIRKGQHKVRSICVVADAAEGHSVVGTESGREVRGVKASRYLHQRENPTQLRLHCPVS